MSESTSQSQADEGLSKAAETPTISTAEATETAAIAPIYKITRIVLIIALLMFVWYLFADRLTPATSEARVRAFLVPIVPQVSGEVIEAVQDINKIVEAGDVLVKIDPDNYRIALQQAQASLTQAGQDIGASTEAVISADARVADAKAQLIYYEQQYVRKIDLMKTGVLSQAEGDKAERELAGGKAQLVSAKAELQKAKQQLGAEGADNPKIRTAMANLKQAQINLGLTTLSAPSDGVVTNVQISVGQYGAKGQPLMTFISATDVWVEAYMRENNLGNMKPGDPVELVLDVAPGRVFKGEVANIGWGVRFDNNSSPGKLPSISSKTGWLRDPQRFPVIIKFSDEQTRGLRREGGQVDVVVYTSENFLFNAAAKIWIRVAAYLSYIY